ncbi:MAG: PAS domain-containing protein [Desulfobacteraceae bacterium]|nr:PAS domain-containing protein [Desulfobacteraceae bacterium]
MIEAFREVPAMSCEQFTRIANLLFTLANQLSTAAYQNVQQACLITEIKQAEKTLQERDKKHRELLEGLNDAAYRMSLPDGKYEYVSQAAKNVFGYDSKSWLNNPQLISTIIHPDFIDYFKQKWAELISGSVFKSYEYTLIQTWKT